MSATWAGGKWVFVEFMRLSLFERDQKDAFEPHPPEEWVRYSREEWIRLIFSRQIEFTHRGSNFTFVPDEELTDDSLVIGRIGRERLVRDNEPPEEGMHERVHAAWQASCVVIDPRHHPDGQKVAMQAREEDIGKPVAVFQSLVSQMNADPSAPYSIEAFGIVDPETFWDFVRKNSGEVVSVTFEAAAPNMFNGKSDFEKELKDLRDQEKSERTKIQLNNPQGLNPDTERMHQIVDYTVKGGGSIKAATRRKKRYNSRSKTQRMPVPEPPEPQQLAAHLVAFVREVIDGLFKK